MGFTYVKLAVSNPAKLEKKVEVKMFVCASAVFTAIPRDIIKELG